MYMYNVCACTCTYAYPFSNKSLTIFLCELSMALIIGVPPLKDCLSVLAPEVNNSLTTASYDDKQEQTLEYNGV